MALALMFNNYFHDLATALFAVSALVAYWILRQAGDGPIPTTTQAIAARLVTLGYVAFAWILVAGVFRVIGYRRYEWVEQAGWDQVWVLGVKHLILVSASLFGVVMIVKVRRRLRESEANP